MGKTSLRKILVGKTLFHENFWREKFLGKTSWENLSAKLLHQKLLSQKKFLGEKFHGEKLLSGENFPRGKLLSRKLPPEFPVTHKNYPGQKKGEPSRKRWSSDGVYFG